MKTVEYPIELKLLNISLSDADERFLGKSQLEKLTRLTYDLTSFGIDLDTKFGATNDATIDSKWKPHDEILRHSHPSDLSIDYIRQLLQLDLKLFAHIFTDIELKSNGDLRKSQRKLFVNYYRERHFDGSDTFLDG